MDRLNTIVSLIRLALKTQFSSYASDSRSANTLVNFIIFSTALNGLVWATATLLTFLYAPSNFLLLVSFIVLGIASGAISSLSPIFKAYLAYVSVAILPLVVTFLLSDSAMMKGAGVLTIFFMLFIVVNGYKYYKQLRETITLKDKLKHLNEDLEGEVKKRTLELKALNNTLEDKVQEEIAKNRLKDQQLVQQSRMAQMGEMISMIAHQWRQPLGAIAASSIDLKMKIAFASFDLDKKESQEACTTYFDKQLTSIEEYVQGLTTTIDDFRNFYKPNKERKTISINEPIKKSLSIMAASAASNGVEITTEYESQKTLALFDSELMQVFLNILKNAQDNFKEKKILDAKITIKTEDTAEGVKVEICDNGGGIPEDIKTKIFDPYFSTKDEKNGTGLGLYMSKAIIEEHHNGELSIENREGCACFIMTLKRETHA